MRMRCSSPKRALPTTHKAKPRRLSLAQIQGAVRTIGQPAYWALMGYRRRAERGDKVIVSGAKGTAGMLVRAVQATTPQSLPTLRRHIVIASAVTVITSCAIRSEGLFDGTSGYRRSSCPISRESNGEVFQPPIFAIVMRCDHACGALSILRLPVEQYPTIAPPSVQITANYPGASAQTVESTVVQVIEQQMTGSIT